MFAFTGPLQPRAILVPVVGMMLACAAISAIAAGPDAAAEIEMLKGHWVVTFAKMGNREASAEDRKDIGIDFDGNKATIAASEFTFGLDPTKDPKHIDLRSGDGVFRGIYKLDDDNLTLCWYKRDRQVPRPTGFSKENSEYSLVYLELKRHKQPVDQAGAPADGAADVLKQSGVHGGFVVHLHCGDGQLTAALRATDSYQVHGLDTSAEQITETRAALQAAGSYGPVSVDWFDGKSLPYIDGMVNLVVAEKLGDVPQAEVERILCPRGVACIRENGSWKKIIKPVPPEIDDWTHYFHDAGGNPVAHDTVVAPPERLQWVGSPRWSRHHDRMSSLSALVSSRGRMYYILDEGSRISIQLPSNWQLIARDAFNGTILWKQPIEKWHDQM